MGNVKANNRSKHTETKTRYKSWDHKVTMVNDNLFKVEYEQNFYNPAKKEYGVRNIVRFMDIMQVRYFFKGLCIPFKVEQP